MILLFLFITNLVYGSSSYDECKTAASTYENTTDPALKDSEQNKCLELCRSQNAGSGATPFDIGRFNIELNKCLKKPYKCLENVVNCRNKAWDVQKKAQRQEVPPAEIANACKEECTQKADDCRELDVQMLKENSNACGTTTKRVASDSEAVQILRTRESDMVSNQGAPTQQSSYVNPLTGEMPGTSVASDRGAAGQTPGTQGEKPQDTVKASPDNSSAPASGQQPATQANNGQGQPGQGQGGGGGGDSGGGGGGGSGGGGSPTGGSGLSGGGSTPTATASESTGTGKGSGSGGPMNTTASVGNGPLPSSNGPAVASKDTATASNGSGGASGGGMSGGGRGLLPSSGLSTYRPGTANGAAVTKASVGGDLFKTQFHGGSYGGGSYGGGGGWYGSRGGGYAGSRAKGKASASSVNKASSSSSLSQFLFSLWGSKTASLNQQRGMASMGGGSGSAGGGAKPIRNPEIGTGPHAVFSPLNNFFDTKIKIDENGNLSN